MPHTAVFLQPRHWFLFPLVVGAAARDCFSRAASVVLYLLQSKGVGLVRDFYPVLLARFR